MFDTIRVNLYKSTQQFFKISIKTKLNMQKKSIFIFVTLIACLLNSCVKYKQNKGLISPESKETSINFTISKTLVILPIKVDGEDKNFILDNGDNMTTISRKVLKGRVTKVGSATGEKAKVGNEVVGSIKIGDSEFKNICAQNLDLSVIENDVPNFGGLIGQAVLSKANWLIDYPKKNIKISTKAINTDGFETISVKNVRDPFVEIQYEGISYKAFVDLGSTTAFSVLESSKLGQILAKKYAFVSESKTTTTASGTGTSTVQRGTISHIKIGNLKFDNLNTVMGKKSSHDIRIGMEFFKDKMLYLDYSNKNFKCK